MIIPAVKDQFLDWLWFLVLSYSQAEVFKEQGNVFYSQKAYSDAFNCYTKAIGKLIDHFADYF